MIKGMITAGKQFHKSVNIAFDLDDKDKIRSLIPSSSAIDLLERIILSTDDNSVDRALVLVGAYGKGKSHIILTIMSMLYGKDKSLYSSLMAKLKEQKPEIYDYVEGYLDSSKKLLPVVINGNSSSLEQSFIGGLVYTLKHNGIENIMPETNFASACNTIAMWKADYPEAYARFCSELAVSIDVFIDKLNKFDVEIYAEYKQLYSKVTNGAKLNEFEGLGVVELYDKVNAKLRDYGYNGIYVVYDEFSKYLESSIKTTPLSDIKMLQDFAEKCSRSGSQQLHLLLICHKEISNYIDILPKQKVDGWRGVNERFSHIVLQSDFSQVYEIMMSAIHKKSIKRFTDFLDNNRKFFDVLVEKYENSTLFNDGTNIRNVVYGCYPLHPVTTFVLPRLSERIAQNERTMFTFLSGNEKNTLCYVADRIEGDVPLVTIDILYDYFATQLRTQHPSSDIYKNYSLSVGILDNLDEDNVLAAKIIKSITIIECLGQLEKLAPTIDTIMSIYADSGYKTDEIKAAIEYLTVNKFVVYIQRSNAQLKLKQTSGRNVPQIIKDEIAKGKGKDIVSMLNKINSKPYIYPTQYNDDNDITRYFRFVFVKYEKGIDWKAMTMAYKGDGVVYGVIVPESENLEVVRADIMSCSALLNNAVFVLPLITDDIESVLVELGAVVSLQESNSNDTVFLSELEIIYQDLMEVAYRYINSYMYPEQGKSSYYYNGKREPIYRKAQLSNRLSAICSSIFTKTPVVNNEVINKDEISSVAKNSRIKLVNGILNNVGTDNLGLVGGSNQEVSFMRSTLKVPGIMLQEDGVNDLTLEPAGDSQKKMRDMLGIIRDFFESSKFAQKSFGELYKLLTDADYGIGLRKGIIPIYVAVVLNKYKAHIIIKESNVEKTVSADLLEKINLEPDSFTVEVEEWSDIKQEYIAKLENIFADNINDNQKAYGGYAYVLEGIRRWYLRLPRYVKEIHKTYSDGGLANVDVKHSRLMNLMKQSGVGAKEILFTRFSKLYNKGVFDIVIADSIAETKAFYDNVLANLFDSLIVEVKTVLGNENEDISLTSVAKDWYGELEEAKRNTLYNDGSEVLVKALADVGDNDYDLIEKLAKVLTDIRIEDWRDDTPINFINRVKECVKTIAEYEVKLDDNVSKGEDGKYAVVFIDNSGKEVKRTFEQVALSERSELLYNEIMNAVDEMGQSISPQEKRQVLLNILEKLC